MRGERRAVWCGSGGGGCVGDKRRVVWAQCCAFSSVASLIAASESESEWSCSCVGGVSGRLES